MRRLSRCAAVVGFLLAAACGSAGPGADTTLSATGSASPEPAPAPTSSTSPTTTVAVTLPPPTATTATTSTTGTTGTTATTVKRAPATTAPPAPRPVPAPPPPATPTTVALDTLVAASTSVTQGATTVTLKAVPEEYLGEKVYAVVEASSTEYIASIRIDFGDGYLTTDAQTQQASLDPTIHGYAARAHVYPTAGIYRITVTVTVVPGLWAFVPTPLPGQWMPTGPEHTVTVAADLLQRPDAAPPGYPRLPALVSE